MSLMIREIEGQTKLADLITLEATATVIPPALVKGIGASATREGSRRRKLPPDVMLWLVIAMNLFTEEALSQVLEKLVEGFRTVWPDPQPGTATKGAISQARTRLGVRPVVNLFRQVCRPRATPDTVGAFQFGLRLMAVDGTTENVPDTSANARAFGRHHTQRGWAAFPQVLGVYLIECGTHCLVDAGFWPCHTSERLGGLRLLRSVGPGMLVLWDRGFHSFEMARRTRDRGAHFLGRVPSGVRLEPLGRYSDGSYAARLYPGDDTKRRGTVYLPVRVVDYTLHDPGQPGHGERHRLITSLLSPTEAPALTVIATYHQRWEIELTIDEVDTHQRALRPLRSQTPLGVRQELYGLLLAHYTVRALMHEAASQAGLAPTRLSFVGALRHLRAAVPRFQLIAPAGWPTLSRRLLADISRCPLPPRSRRSYPRVVKRQSSKFPLKRSCTLLRPPPSLPFLDTVVLLI